MGMTDRQFDAHNKTLLRHYENIEKEIQEIVSGKTDSSETLRKLIEDTKEQLQRP